MEEQDRSSKRRKHEKSADSAGMVAAAQAFLTRTPLSAVARQDQKLTVLEHSDTVARAMQEFHRAKILSAPVVISPDLEDLEEETVPEERNSTPTLLGWVDISDLVDALIAHLESKAPEGLPTKMLALMKLIEAEGPVFAAKELITVTGGEDKDLIFQAHTGTTVLDTLRDHYLKLAEDGTTKVVHRVAIFDTHGTITHVISQLDVMRFLLAHAELLGGVLDASLEALGMLAGRAPVKTVSAHEPTLLALRRVLAAGVGGAAVVEGGAGGAVIANLSTSDLRSVQPGHLSTLALPVAEFLALQHHTAYQGYAVHSADAGERPFFAARSSSSSGSLAGGSPRAGAPPGEPPAPSDGGAAGAPAARQDFTACPPPPARAPGGALNGGAAAGAADTADASGGGEPGAASAREAEAGGACAGPDDEDIRLIACAPTATLREVLELLTQHEVHRVYVVAPGGPPHAQAAITPTDVMRLLAGVW